MHSRSGMRASSFPLPWHRQDKPTVTESSWFLIREAQAAEPHAKITPCSWQMHYSPALSGGAHDPMEPLSLSPHAHPTYPKDDSGSNGLPFFNSYKYFQAWSRVLPLFAFHFQSVCLDRLHTLGHWQAMHCPSVRMEWSPSSQQVTQIGIRTSQARRQPRDIDSEWLNSFHLNHKYW